MNEEPIWRCFTCVEADESVRAALARGIERLRRCGAHVSWTVPEKLHVTLTFHGDQPRCRIETLCAALEAVCADRSAFDVDVRGTGSFGKPGSPRVLWAGIADGAEQLAGLQHVVADVARRAGMLPDTRPFHPHITLGRVKRANPPQRLELTRELERLAIIAFGRFRANRVVLMRSELLPTGSRFTPVRILPLRP